MNAASNIATLPASRTQSIHDASALDTPVQRMLRWEPHMSVGSPEFDAHHRHLGLLINCLANANTGPQGAPAAHDILMELADYAGYHFEAEEVLMLALGFPEIDRHRAEHAQFCEMIGEAGYGAALGIVDHSALVTYLTRWWSGHIQEEDAKYKPYLIAFRANHGPLEKATSNRAGIHQEKSHAA